ncbi:MAG: Hsp20/alpha crystallin family protein [Candidatus Riflebacteria bacterium]|nr:Hsp20/alpha crystallin family protein [Candidatus Riflebacteria bacterium]
MNIFTLFKEMESLQTQLSSVFREFGQGKFPKIAFLPGVSPRHFPMVNIGENDEKLFVECLAPGIDISSLKITVTNEILTISGEKPESKIPEEKYHRCERAAGKFTRTVELPMQIDREKVSAEYKNGILTIILPKAESAKPKSIEVKVS